MSGLSDPRKPAASFMRRIRKALERFLVLELKRELYTQPANPLNIDDVHREAV